MNKKHTDGGILAENRRARHDLEILETFQAGIVLSGPEVKSAKAGNISLASAFVTLHGGEAYLLNAHIGPYKPASAVQKTYDPTQRRKLLLRKSEIKGLIGRLQAEGLTAVPLAVYTTQSGFVKVTVGLGRGRLARNKKEILKRRAIDREIRGALKGAR